MHISIYPAHSLFPYTTLFRSVFGSTTKHIIPGSSFDTDMDELSYFIQANFEVGQLSGNLGVRVVETDLTVKQKIAGDRKSTRLNTSHVKISYAVFCLKKKNNQ